MAILPTPQYRYYLSRPRTFYLPSSCRAPSPDFQRTSKCYVCPDAIALSRLYARRRWAGIPLGAIVAIAGLTIDTFPIARWT